MRRAVINVGVIRNLLRHAVPTAGFRVRRLENLEPRLLLAGHVWSGALSGNWSEPGNWIGGAPAASESNLTLEFPLAAANRANTNDVPGLTVDQLTFTGADYTLAGTGVTLAGNLTVDPAVRGSNAVALDLTLVSSLAVSIGYAFAPVELRGVLSGSGGIAMAGPGRLVLSGNNSFTGAVIIQGGDVDLTTSTALGSPNGDTTVLSGGRLTLTNNITIEHEVLHVAGGAPLSNGGQPALVSSFGGGAQNATWSGLIILTGDTTMGVEDASLTLNSIPPITGNFALTLSGQGTNSRFIINAPVNTAGITLTNAMLTLNSTQAPPIQVEGGDSGAILNGIGHAAAVTLTDSQFSPGDPLGTFTTGNFQSNNSVLRFEFQSPNATDHLAVQGTVTLGGPLNVDLLTNYRPQPGTTRSLIENDGTDPVTGTFNAHPEGAKFIVGDNQLFQITYAGGDGNDVVITKVSDLLDSTTTVSFVVPTPQNGNTQIIAHVNGAGPTPTGTAELWSVSVLGSSVLTSAAVDAYGNAAFPPLGTRVSTRLMVNYTGSDVYRPSDYGAFYYARPATHLYATGADSGGGPHVVAYDVATGATQLQFMAYDPAFTGGVRVAVGDFNGDSIDDVVTAPGPGGGPHIKITSGADGSLISQFLAYDPSFRGGVYVAAGDVNHDGVPEIITGADAGGGPHVEVFQSDGTLLRTFYAYDPSFRGGVRVAAGDINHDGFADIITGAGPGGGPHVQAFSGSDNGLLQSFYAYAPSFTGGVYVAAGDVNGDGFADIITGAGAGGGPHVQAFSGGTGTPLVSLLAYDGSFHGGTRVAASDIDGDGLAEILTSAGPGGQPEIRFFAGATHKIVRKNLPYSPTFEGGVFVG